MKNLITDRRKIAEGRGTGTGKDYIPFVFSQEFSSMGTCSIIVDWTNGRSVETLSQGEANYWYILRFDDRITDIREQFPLELEATNRIAERLGVRPVRKGESCMTNLSYKKKEKAFSLLLYKGVLVKKERGVYQIAK